MRPPNPAPLPDPYCRVPPCTADITRSGRTGKGGSGGGSPLLPQQGKEKGYARERGVPPVALPSHQFRLHSIHVQLRKLRPGSLSGLAQRLGPDSPSSRCRGGGKRYDADRTAFRQPVQCLRGEVQGGGGSGAGPGNQGNPAGNYSDWRQCSRRPTLQEATQALKTEFQGLDWSGLPMEDEED